MQPPVLVTAPAVMPVTLSEAKAHLRVDHDDEDTLITALIAAATGHLDGWTGVLGRCIVSQTWRQDMDGFGDGDIRLPFADVTAVVVAYTDTANATQTFAGASYHLTADAMSSLIELADGASWPDTAIRPDAVRVTMTVGYSAVPPAIKAAILIHIGQLYENREVSAMSAVAMLPLAHDALVSPYRRVGV
jgi:uncharacterized phiE125 gp8 family phage protein